MPGKSRPGSNRINASLKRPVFSTEAYASDMCFFKTLAYASDVHFFKTLQLDEVRDRKAENNIYKSWGNPDGIKTDDTNGEKEAVADCSVCGDLHRRNRTLQPIHDNAGV
jgi:hypothetical protein